MDLEYELEQQNLFDELYKNNNGESHDNTGNKPYFPTQTSTQKYNLDFKIPIPQINNSELEQSLEPQQVQLHQSLFEQDTGQKQKQEQEFVLEPKIIHKHHHHHHNTNNQNVCEEQYHPFIIAQESNNILSNVDDLVDEVITNKRGVIFKENKTGLEFTDEENTVETKGSQKKPWLAKKEFLDVSTDFVTNNFLSHQKDISKFLFYFIAFMEKGIEAYLKKKKQIIKNKYNHNIDSLDVKGEKVMFVYKGGNTMKNILDKYLYEFPGFVADTIFDIYKDYFKKSDMDFQIFISKDLHPDKTLNGINDQIYTELFNDLTVLSYYLLNRFRNYILCKLDDSFSTYRLKKRNVSKLLNEVKDKLNESNIINKNPNLIEKEFGSEFRDFSGMKFTNVKFTNINADKNVDKQFQKLQRKQIFIPQKNSNIMLNDSQNDNLNNDETYLRIIVDYIQTKDVDNFARRDFELNLVGNKKVLSKLPLIHTDANLSNLRDYQLQKNLYQDKSIGTEFYVSVNKTLCFEERGVIKCFNLIRMKVNFIGYFETKDKKHGAMHIPGELIDISISSKDDTKIDKFKKENLSKYMKQYKYKNKNTDKYGFEYYCYNFTGFIEDLFTILFDDAEYPWEDTKYKKRIYRVMFFMLTELFSKKNTTRQNLRNNFNNIIKYLDELIPNIYNQQNVNLLNILDQESSIYKFFNKTLNLINKFKNIQDITIRAVNEKNFKDYIEVIKENVNIGIEIINSFEQYESTKTPGKIYIDGLRADEINLLGGKKYKRY